MDEQRSQILSQAWEKYSKYPVWLVALPLPPDPVRGMIYMPDCFMSSVFDRDHSQTSSEFSVIAIKPTHLGPAILIRVKLEDLIELRISKIRTFEVVHAAICASVEYYPLIETGDLTFADKVDIVKLNFIGQSCNRNSHFIVPDAPFLSAFLQYHQSRYDEDADTKYLSPDDAKALFPEADFTRNVMIDSIIREGTIPVETSFVTNGCVGDWALPCFKQLRRNLIKPVQEEVAHALLGKDFVFSVSGQENGSKVESATVEAGIN